MKRTEITVRPEEFPACFHKLLEGARVFDSSCSPEARVWLIRKEQDFYLKSAPSGALDREAAVTGFFHSKGLGAQVLDYVSDDQDWMLTRAVSGEDCLDPQYLQDPVRLCDTTAELLRRLHNTDPTGCPVDRTGNYIRRAKENYLSGNYDRSLFPDNWGYATPEEAWRVVEATAPLLRRDTLLHGDYCLPNIMLDNWQFSGFIDLDCGGLGDRHIDLFWGIWSLEFNLKTDRYRDRFLDAYGRSQIEPELLNTIGAFEVFQ